MTRDHSTLVGRGEEGLREEGLREEGLREEGRGHYLATKLWL